MVTSQREEQPMNLTPYDNQRWLLSIERALVDLKQLPHPPDESGRPSEAADRGTGSERPARTLAAQKVVVNLAADP
jgi:hypothetical protein